MDGASQKHNASTQKNQKQKVPRVCSSCKGLEARRKTVVFVVVFPQKIFPKCASRNADEKKDNGGARLIPARRIVTASRFVITQCLGRRC